jgi:hypothetical protein
MKRLLRTFAFIVGIGLTPALLLHVAQAQSERDHSAYQSGYQHGVGDAQKGRSMHMDTDDYRGDHMASYRQGYEEGYRSVRGNGYANAGPGRYEGKDQEAFQKGYERGVRDREHNRAMSNGTDDYRGERLQAYREGYEQGYRNGNALGREHHDDDDRH